MLIWQENTFRDTMASKAMAAGSAKPVFPANQGSQKKQQANIAFFFSVLYVWCTASQQIFDETTLTETDDIRTAANYLITSSSPLLPRFLSSTWFWNNFKWSGIEFWYFSHDIFCLNRIHLLSINLYMQNIFLIRVCWEHKQSNKQLRVRTIYHTLLFKTVNSLFKGTP